MNPIKVLPEGKITDCVAPHIHVYSCKSETSVHAVAVSDNKLRTYVFLLPLKNYHQHISMSSSPIYSHINQLAHT